MKKALIFSLAYYPHVGGAEVAVKEITDRINSEEFSFDMVTLRFDTPSPSIEKIGNCTVYRVRLLFLPLSLQKLCFPFTAFLKARSLHLKNSYDLVWSIMANRAGFATLFFKIKFPKIPFLLTLQEGDDEKYPLERMGVLKPILAPLWKKIFTKADRIQVISNYLKDWAISNSADCPIEVVPNGVNVEAFSVKNLGVEGEIRKKLGYKQNDVLLITTSRLVEKNAVEDVIQAMKYLPESVKFLILGMGHLEETLRQTTNDLQLDERVRFLGFVPNPEIPPYLWDSDIFIRPSLSEGMGNSFIEAMVAGLPVIATPVGGIVDFLKDGKTGLFCKVRNPRSIAEKVNFLISNPELKSLLVKNGFELSANYDWRGISSGMKKTFDTLLN